MAIDDIANSANGPRQVSVSGMGESSEHSLPDQIAFDRYQRATNAQGLRGFFGCIVRKMRKPGAVYHHGREGNLS